MTLESDREKLAVELQRRVDLLFRTAQSSTPSQLLDKFVNNPELLDDLTFSVLEQLITEFRTRASTDPDPKHREIVNAMQLVAKTAKLCKQFGVERAFALIESVPVQSEKNRPATPSQELGRDQEILRDLDAAMAQLDRYENFNDATSLSLSVSTLRTLLRRIPPWRAADSRMVHIRLQAILLFISGLNHQLKTNLLADLNELKNSIYEVRDAVKLVDEKYQSLCCKILSEALLNLFAAHGVSSDIQDAIDWAGRGAKVAKEQLGKAECLNNLCRCLLAKYDHQGTLEDLDGAFAAILEAEKNSLRGKGVYPAILNNKAVCFREKYDRFGDLADLFEAIRAQQRALKAISKSDFEFALYVHNLGFMHRQVYEAWRRTSTAIRDISAERHLAVAIGRHEQCLALSPKGPFENEALGNLGSCLFERFLLKGNPVDLGRAIDLRERAFANEHPTNPKYPVRIHQLASSLAQRFQQEKNAGDRDRARELFRVLAVMSGPSDPEERLTGVHNWLRWEFECECWKEVTEAFGYAAEIHVYLRSIQKTRKSKEAWIRETKNLSSMTAFAFVQLGQPTEATAVIERSTAVLLEEALKRKNSEDMAFYGMTASEDRVRSKVSLVYVFTTHKGGVAIIVSPLGDTKAVKLPTVIVQNVYDVLMKNVHAYLPAYSEWLSSKTESALEKFIESIRTVAEWTGTNIAAPLRSEIGDSVEFAWIPVGLLSLLPLHLARTNDESGKPLYLLDEYVMRFLPKASIASAFNDTSKEVSLLSVDVPTAPDSDSLEFTWLETQSAKIYFPNITQLDQSSATKAAVLLNARAANVIHFAGHAVANPTDPLRSAFMVSGGDTITLSDILELNLDGATLAILSACETSLRGHELLDESISFPTGLIQAGFRGVIATMWSVSDLAAALIMAYFYQCWRERRFTISQALLASQKWLRDATIADLLNFIGERNVVLGGNSVGWQTAMQVIQQLGRPDERPFKDEFWWGAFVLHGTYG